MNKKIIFGLVLILLAQGVLADNSSLNYLWNESCTTNNALCWTPWTATEDGKANINIDFLNISAENASVVDSLLTDYIYPEGNVDTKLKNVTILEDVHILGTLYGGSPLKVGGDIQLTGNITDANSNVIMSNDATGNLTVEDSFATDYIYSRTNPFTTILNLSILQDIISTGNITGSDSILTDYIFTDNNAVVQVQNLTVVDDIYTAGSYYGDGSQLTGISTGLSLSNYATTNESNTFTDEILIGSNNISSTYVGIGTTTPLATLHIEGSLNMSNNKIQSLATPINDDDAATKAYADTAGGDATAATQAEILANLTVTLNNLTQLLADVAAISNNFGAWTFGGIAHTTYGGQQGPSTWFTMTGNRKYLIGFIEKSSEMTPTEANFAIVTGTNFRHFSAALSDKDTDTTDYANVETDIADITQMSYVIVEHWTTGGIDANLANSLVQNNCFVRVQGDGDILYDDTSPAADCAFFYYYIE